MDVSKYQTILQYMKTHTYPPGMNERKKRSLRKLISKSIILKNEQLYHLRDGKYLDDRAKREEMAQKIIFGDVEKQRILREVHSGVGGGHFGQNKMQEKIAERFWWPCFSKDVRDYCKSCDACQKANPVHAPGASEAHPIPVSDKLFSRWCVDLIGPLVLTPRGNQYIAVATEYLTRYPVVKALPSKEAVEVCQFIFEDIICQFGCMDKLQHDQGREFTNALLENMTGTLGIKNIISSAYHPQTNGLTERFNQTLETQLMKLDVIQNWDLELQPKVFAYRTAIQDSTMKSPFEMMFGCRARVPIDVEGVAEGNDLLDKNFEAAVAKRLQVVSTELIACRNEGLANLKKAQKKQKKFYDLKHQSNKVSFEVGDKVLKKDAARDSRQGGRTKPRYLPVADGHYYVIREKLEKGVCLLHDPFRQKDLAGMVNHKHLKSYVEAASSAQSASIAASAQRPSTAAASMAQTTSVAASAHGTTVFLPARTPISNMVSNHHVTSIRQPTCNPPSALGRTVSSLPAMILLIPTVRAKMPALSETDIRKCIEIYMKKPPAERKYLGPTTLDAVMTVAEGMWMATVLKGVAEKGKWLLSREVISKSVEILREENPDLTSKELNPLVEIVYERARQYTEVTVLIDDKSQKFILHKNERFATIFDALAHVTKVAYAEICLTYEENDVCAEECVGDFGGHDKILLKYERKAATPPPRPDSPDTVLRRQVVKKNRILARMMKSEPIQNRALELLRGTVSSYRQKDFEKWWSTGHRGMEKPTLLGPFFEDDDTAEALAVLDFYADLSLRHGGTNPVVNEQAEGNRLPPSTDGFIYIVVFFECMKLALIHLFGLTLETADIIATGRDKDNEVYLSLTPTVDDVGDSVYSDIEWTSPLRCHLENDLHGSTDRLNDTRSQLFLGIEAPNLEESSSSPRVYSSRKVRQITPKPSTGNSGPVTVDASMTSTLSSITDTMATTGLTRTKRSRPEKRFPGYVQTGLLTDIKKKKPVVDSKTTNTNPADPVVDGIRKDEHIYCFCKQVSSGKMVACDNRECRIQWFHYNCVGVKIKPKGKWYCPNCRGVQHTEMKKL